MARIALTIAGVVAGATIGYFAGPGLGLSTFNAIPGGTMKGASLGKLDVTQKKTKRRGKRESRYSGGHKR